MTDERESLPSASAMPALSLCPGRWRMTRGLPELSTPKMADWGASGDRIHLWLEAPDMIDLEPDELKVGEMCLAARDKLIRQVMPDWENHPPTVLTEKRLWLYCKCPMDTNSDGNCPVHPRGCPTIKRFSGRMDFSAVSHNRKVALVADYKTGRGEQDEADNSLQLRSQAVLLWLDLLGQPDEVYVSMIQPLVGKPILCKYDRAALGASLKELSTHLDAIEAPDAPLVPGKAQCQHCSARLVCPSAWKEVEAVSEVNPAFLEGVRLSVMLDKWAVAKQVGALLEARSKQLLDVDANAIPNWGLKPGGETRSVSMPYLLFRNLTKAKLVKSAKDFITKYCTVTIGNLEKHLGKEVVNDECASAISKTKKEPSLKRL